MSTNTRMWSSFKKAQTQTSSTLNFIHSGRRRYISEQLSRNFPSIPSVLLTAIFPLYHPAAADFVFFWEIPSQNRLGHTNLYGLMFGASHGMLEGIIEDAEGAKGSRNIYAETRRENMQVMESIRHSDWNTEMNPLVLLVRNFRPRTHDFSTGWVAFHIPIPKLWLSQIRIPRPCHLAVEMVLRNHSLTLPARYVLKLQSGARTEWVSVNLNATVANRFVSGSLPMMYTGRLLFRGELAPCQAVSIKPSLWVTRPGTYNLESWSLETEISLQHSDGSSLRTRKKKYLQGPSATYNACIVVYDSRTTS